MNLQSTPFVVYALELHAVGHCNLRCRGCSQSSPSVPSRFESTGVLEQSLAALRGLLRCRKLYILGGEPLLHPQIEDILSVAANAQLGGEICLKTNGLLLPRMSPGFWQLVDRVAVSVYPASERALQRHRKEVEQMACAHRAELSYVNVDRFRHIVGAAARTSERLVRHVFEGCEYKTYTHSVSGGRLFRCAPSVNLRAASFHVADSDSVDLLGGAHTGDAVAGFLQSSVPLSACRYCLGSSGGTFPHTMASKAGRVLHDRHA